jgi:hypothetical protein
LAAVASAKAAFTATADLRLTTFAEATVVDGSTGSKQTQNGLFIFVPDPVGSTGFCLLHPALLYSGGTGVGRWIIKNFSAGFAKLIIRP